MVYIKAIFGVLILLGIAWVFSKNKKAISWKLVGIGLSLQVLFGILVLKVSWARAAFNYISEKFVIILGYSSKGADFLFGSLANADGMGFIFVFQVLPTVIFFSTLTAGLYYLGVLQYLVKGIAWVMMRTMGLSGAESLSAAGNIFLGQTEAPLLVRPFVPGMTRSELMCLMTGGMATISGGVLAGYVAFLGGDDPEARVRFASFLLSASVMNAPAAIIMSKILIPEVHHDKIDKQLKVTSADMGVNLIDVLSKGAKDGLKLAANIGGMLLAFIAVIAALNGLLSWLGDLVGLNTVIASTTGGTFDGLSFEYLLGQVFRPFAWIMGVEWAECLQVGSLLGQKTVINEFIAYEGLAEMKEAGSLSPKSIVIATYALCGFANFSSIAIQIGGIGGMAPNQEVTLSQLGFRALLAATLATMITATLAGVILG